MDMLQPLLLFDAYADAKNLSSAVVALGRELVELSAAEASVSVEPPCHVAFESVTVESFGCFAQRVTYPLSARGLLLLRG